MNLESAWNAVEGHIHDHGDCDADVTTLRPAIRLLLDADLIRAVEEELLFTFENSVKEMLFPMLSEESDCTFPVLIHEICKHAKKRRRMINSLLTVLEEVAYTHQILESCQRIYKTTLEYSHHHRITQLAKHFYTKAYSVCTAQQDDMVEDDSAQIDDQSCSRCGDSPCQCEDIRSQMSAITTSVQELGIFHNIIEETLFIIVKSKIKEHVVSTSSGTFDRHFIQDLVSWLNGDLIEWLEKVTVNLNASEILSTERLLYYLYDSFVRLRLEEMLPMIIDFPDSKPGFEDLQLSLPKCNLRKELIKTIKKVYESRILHPGVTTTDILTAYIHSIQALRVLDPSCVLLEIVTEPVKQYLRSRDDTVRCIVSNLIDDSCEVLADELTKGTSDQDIIDEDNIGDDWQHWLPDPVDANPEISSKTRRSTDIINMLVNIYGTKELFIKEYWNLLADRLLSTLSYTTLWEIRYFELLKIRFGESDLHKCEVMLKDVTDSKRLNNWINDELQKAEIDQQIPFQMNAMILSAQYWPSFREEKLDLPQEMQAALEKYTKAYEITKVNRTLKWQPHIGQVEIDIELDSGKLLTIKTSPVNVAIIMAFQEKEVYTVDELSEKLQTSSAVIRRRISYWQTHGILKEQSQDTFRLNKDHTTGPIAELIEEEEVESATASAEQQREEEFQVMWSYINGMLTNMESQSLERIHAMLKMFANTECSIHDLERFLSRKIREGKLVCAAGVYKLVTA